jgi:hypothetical protein
MPATLSARSLIIKILDCLFVSVAVVDYYDSLILFPATFVPALSDSMGVFRAINGILTLIAVVFAIGYPIYWRWREIKSRELTGWEIIDQDHRKPINTNLHHAWFTGIIRYWIAGVIFNYAFAKILGTQFAHIYSRDDSTMSSLSGLDITWHFFGYSYILSCIIAGLQIAGAVLLLFRRTTIIGVIILLPVMLNIVLIDIFFSLPGGALFNAIALSAGLLYLLSLYWPLIRTLFERAVPALPQIRLGGTWIKYAVRFLLAAYAFGFIYYVTTKRSPANLIGKWKVEELVRNGDTVKANDWLINDRSWKSIYLEQNGTFIFSPNPYIAEKRRSLTGRYTWDEGTEEIVFISYPVNGISDTLHVRQTKRPDGLTHWNLITDRDTMSLTLSKADEPKHW